MIKVYLSGEIHSDWRDQITREAEGLGVEFSGPNTITQTPMIVASKLWVQNPINFGMTIKAQN
jgi:hypothetical protein